MNRLNDYYFISTLPFCVTLPTNRLSGEKKLLSWQLVKHCKLCSMLYFSGWQFNVDVRWNKRCLFQEQRMNSNIVRHHWTDEVICRFTYPYTSCCCRPSWRSSSVCSWSSPPSTRRTTRSSCCSPESVMWSTHRSLKDNQEGDRTKDGLFIRLQQSQTSGRRMWRCVYLLCAAFI